MTTPSQPLAYLNHKFLDSEDARPLRILAEYLERPHILDAGKARGWDVLGFEPSPMAMTICL